MGPVRPPLPVQEADEESAKEKVVRPAPTFRRITIVEEDEGADEEDETEGTSEAAELLAGWSAALEKAVQTPLRDMISRLTTTGQEPPWQEPQQIRLEEQ